MSVQSLAPEGDESPTEAASNVARVLQGYGSLVRWLAGDVEDRIHLDAPSRDEPHGAAGGAEANRYTYSTIGLFKSNAVASVQPGQRAALLPCFKAAIARGRLGGSLSASLPEIGAVRASGVYDLYVQRVRSYAFALDAFPAVERSAEGGRRDHTEVSAGAHLDYDLPTFDADSIFNWFSHEGTTSAVAELVVAPTRALEFGASAGVRIFEYQPTFLHSKFAVFDGRWSVFGSPNVNARSRHLDEENAYGVLDQSLGHELEEMFAGDLKPSEEVRLEEWRKRSDLVRFLQWMSKLLDEQS